MREENKMQAIETKYFPPTNTRGARIKAECARGSVTISFPHELSGDDVHRAAVAALVKKFIAEDEKQYRTPPGKNPWAREFLTGSLKNGNAVHVFIPIKS